MPFYKAARLYAEEGYDARFLPRIMKHLGPTVTIDDIDDVRIAEIGAALYPQSAPDTRRRQVKVPIMAVCRWAKGERRKPSTDRPRIRWLTPEEAERLINAAAQLTLPRHSEPERFTLAKIAFLLGTGCRTGECFASDVSDWNPATGEWWVPAQEVGAGKTMRSARWALVAPRAVELMGDLPLHGRAFRTPYGQPIVLRKNGGGQMAAAFEKARIAAGLGPDVTPHVLRHTWATWRYAQTGDLLGLDAPRWLGEGRHGGSLHASRPARPGRAAGCSRVGSAGAEIVPSAGPARGEVREPTRALATFAESSHAARHHAFCSTLVDHLPHRHRGEYGSYSCC